MTSGILRTDAVPGRPGGHLTVVGNVIADQGSRLRRVEQRTPPSRPVPVFRMDERVAVTGTATETETHGMPVASASSMSVDVDVWADAGTMGVVRLRDDIGVLAQAVIELPYQLVNLASARGIAGTVLTVTGIVTAGTGHLYLRARTAYA